MLKSRLGQSPKKCSRKKRRVPLYFWIVGGTTVFAGLLYLLFRLSTPFAEWFNGSIGAFFRRILAYATCLLPFSLAETLLIALPLILGFLIFFGIRNHNESFRSALLYCGSILSVLCIVGQLFVYAFAAGYSAKTADQKFGIERKDVSAEELYETACILVERINEENDAIYFRADGFSIMPYTVYTMNSKLLDAYDTLGETYDCVDNFYSLVKPVALSEAMSYTHITGVYTFFTGESNLNVNFPDYTLPYTAAHELAHQRGFAREDEANFVAFLVCISSDDAYIRYSGYVGMYEYVMSALYKADKELYASVRARAEESLLLEQKAYSAFFSKYKTSTVSTVSGAINNSYLQSQGTVGTKSYGMVVDLTVAYYKKQAAK